MLKWNLRDFENVTNFQTRKFWNVYFVVVLNFYIFQQSKQKSENIWKGFWKEKSQHKLDEAVGSFIFQKSAHMEQSLWGFF